MLQGKQKRAQETRQRILVAATDLFNQGNFNAVSTESIAEQANVSKGTLFAHFGDKLGLFAEIGLKELKICVDALHEEAETSTASGREQLNHSLMMILQYFEKQPEFLRIFIDVAGWEKGSRQKTSLMWPAASTSCFSGSSRRASRINPSAPWTQNWGLFPCVRS